MTSVKDTASFFANGTTKQFDYCYKLYPEVLKLKAEARCKKPEELIRLDDWYQNELPKKLKGRGKDAHMVHEELVQTMKWKQLRGKFYPQLSYLVKVNTPRAVMQETKKAFRKLPNLEQAITALSNLKGVGTTMASALLAACAPDFAPFMADECLMAIPEIEGIDYTTKEYLNFVQHIQTAVTRLNAEKDSNSSWSPHRVELALWAHYVATDLKPELLDDMPDSTSLTNPVKKFATSIDDQDDEENNSVIDGVTTTNSVGLNTTSELKQTNGGTDTGGSGDGGGGDCGSITTDENSISNDSQDVLIDPTNNIQVTSIDSNLKLIEKTSSNVTATKINVGGGLEPIHHSQEEPIDVEQATEPVQLHNNIITPQLIVNDDTTTASSTTVDDDAGRTPNTIEPSDESNLELLVSVAANGNNGNGALDSLDESSTRSEDSLEKPIVANDDSDSVSSAKRSLDCESSESNSQPELKKIRSD